MTISTTHGYRKTLRSFAYLFLLLVTIYAPESRAVTSVENIYTYSGGTWNVEDIVFTGVEYEKTERLEKVMDTREESFYRFLFNRNSYRFDPRTFLNDLERIKIRYRSKGFLEMEIPEAVIEEDRERNRLTIHITIDEGRQIFLQEVSIKGNEFISTSTILRTFNAIPGEPFDVHRFETGREEIRFVYRSNGFLEAEVKADYRIDDSSNTAQLYFSVIEGPVYTFGGLTVGGNERVRDDIIIREIVFQQGERYSHPVIRRSQQKLFNTGLFSMVRFSTGSKDSVKHRQDMKLSVKERKSRWLSLGIGSGTSERQNFRFSADWENRNLFGTGRYIWLQNVLSFEIGEFAGVVPNRFGATIVKQKINYTEPWIFGLPLDGSVYGNNEWEKFYYDVEPGEESFWRHKWGETVSVSRDFGEYTKLWTGVEMEWVRYAAIPLDELQTVLSEEDLSGVTHSISLVGERDTRDNIFDPSRGTSERVSLKYAGDFLGGDYTFRKVFGNFTFYNSLTASELIAGRIQFGYADHPERSDEVPLHERFFTGGATSVRGYSEREIGDPEGGNVLLLGNCELRISLTRNVGTVFFLDAGNVWSYWSMTDLKDMRLTTGVGLRYQTIIGPLRLDYGFRCNAEEREEGVPGKFHLSIGHTF
jgi:outer membrane protein assembly complex protein YaeT